jgi:hypothetical protein
MDGLARSVGDSIGGLFAGTIGAAAEAVRGAVHQLQASVPPLVLIVGVFVVLAGAAWLLARR